jgi:hypothetical protein
MHQVSFDDNAAFAFYSSVATVNLQQVTISNVRTASIIPTCPAHTQNCNMNLNPNYPYGEPLQFGYGFHACGAPLIKAEDLRISGVNQFAFFLFAVGSFELINPTTSMFEGDWGYRYRPTDEATIFSQGDDPRINLNIMGAPVAEKVLWGEPPSKY